MKLKFLMGLSSALCLGVMSAQAQETNEVAELKHQLQVMQEQFEQTRQAQQQQLENLQRQLAAMQASQPTNPAPTAVAVASSGSPEQPVKASPPPPASWSLASPITMARAGSAYLNISFDALMAAGGSTESDPSAQLQLGDHDPSKNGFSLRNAEIALDGAVDPYFKGFANIVLKLDNNNETEIELEETYLQSTSLPWNLQVKGGQFFASFGRQNAQHPHQWAFVDQPIILGRAFGPDGLRNLGAQLSWLAPLPFFTEATLGVFDGQGGTAFGFRNPGEDDGAGVNRFHGRSTFNRGLEGGGDLLFVPRLASSFDLTEEQTLVVGASAAFGPNDTGENSRTEIYGADVYWKWKPSDADAGFPFVSWQTEVLYERFGAGADASAPTPLPAETLADWGGYSQVLWGFKPRWVVGLRGEYANGNHGAYDASDVYRGERERVSPDLTFFLSEFSKIRLQYNYDHGEHFGDAHSLWLQVEFMLGAHGAHKF